MILNNLIKCLSLSTIVTKINGPYCIGILKLSELYYHKSLVENHVNDLVFTCFTNSQEKTNILFLTEKKTE